MVIILLFLAKSLDKHGITVVHITYPALHVMVRFRTKTKLSVDKSTIMASCFISVEKKPSWPASGRQEYCLISTFLLVS